MVRGCVIGCALLIVGCSQSTNEDARIEVTETDVAIASADGIEGVNEAETSHNIIYEAEVEIVVHNFSATEVSVPRLVKEHGGYLSQVSIDRTSGEHRSGSWQARIPVAQFDSFLSAVSNLGIPENHNQTAQDVTEEFVDLEIRVANKKRLENRILELLDKSDETIADVIEVERELARVRGEIERMQGRIRYLTNRTEMTTVFIVAREQHDYVPPEAPTFLARTGQAWGNSLVSLRSLAEGAAVAMVFAFPWLLALLVLSAPPLWYIRHRGIPGTASENKSRLPSS